MSYKVVCFSRTGNSERVAQKLAKELSTSIIKITDGLDWSGPWGYIKAGYYSVKNKDIDIKINGKIDSSDEIILVSPLWAGGLASATKAFLKKFPAEKIHLVVTSNGSTMKECLEFKSVNGIIRSKKNEDAVIKDLVRDLGIS